MDSLLHRNAFLVGFGPNRGPFRSNRTRFQYLIRGDKASLPDRVLDPGRQLCGIGSVEVLHQTFDVRIGLELV
jgi:hypothetical protein